MIRYEPAYIDDLAEILAVQRLAFYNVAKHLKNFRLRPLMVSLADLELAYGDYRYFKACQEDGTIIGSARAKVIDAICKIEGVVVHPDFQRQGIGQRIMKLTETAHPHCHQFELFTGRDTPGNVAFYQGLGYRISHEIPASASEALLVIMKKERVLS